MNGLNRETVLSGFANGQFPASVFGPDRPLVAQQLTAWVAGIEPTDAELAEYAWNDWHSDKVKAYRNGRAYLLSAYYGYGTERLTER